ncbi:uncharacterized protein LOC135143585 [Zophobas morio]|uniref:uncharacterized protein LOC135143585 n=1 Tax=Zophobas morio TaxID=2755281 RepID=UPI00308310A0
MSFLKEQRGRFNDFIDVALEKLEFALNLVEIPDCTTIKQQKVRQRSKSTQTDFEFLDSHLVISKINEVGVKDIPTLPPEAEVDACRIERKASENFKYSLLLVLFLTFLICLALTCSKLKYYKLMKDLETSTRKQRNINQIRQYEGYYIPESSNDNPDVSLKISLEQHKVLTKELNFTDVQRKQLWNYMCSFQALERATPLNDDNLNLREVLDDFNVETALYLVGTIYVLFTLYTKSIKFLLGSNTAPTPLGARTARLLPFFRSLFLVFAMAYVGLQNFKERKANLWVSFGTLRRLFSRGA